MPSFNKIRSGSVVPEIRLLGQMSPGQMLLGQMLIGQMLIGQKVNRKLLPWYWSNPYMIFTIWNAKCCKELINSFQDWLPGQMSPGQMSRDKCHMNKCHLRNGIYPWGIYYDWFQKVLWPFSGLHSFLRWSPTTGFPQRLANNWPRVGGRIFTLILKPIQRSLWNFTHYI